MLDTIKEWIEDILQWLLEALLWIPRKIWAEILEGLAAVFNAIPVPQFVTDMGPAFQSIASGTMYFLDVFQFDYGLTVLLSAYLLRFGLRRIPLIG